MVAQAGGRVWPLAGTAAETCSLGTSVLRAVSTHTSGMIGGRKQTGSRPPGAYHGPMFGTLETLFVMMTIRNIATSVVPIALVALLASCGDTSTPTAPSTTSATAVSESAPSTDQALNGVGVDLIDRTDLIDVKQLGHGGPIVAELDEALSAPDGTTLKVPAPTLVSPLNNAVVSSLTPLLTLANSAPRYVASATFTYRFEIFQVLGGGSTTRVEAASAAQGAGTTSYRVNLQLEQATTYQWRARVEFDGAAGPWSTTATFMTPVLLGVPTPVFPINGATTQNTRPIFVVQNGDVPAGAGAVTYQFQLDDEGSSFPNPSMFNVPRSPGTRTAAQFADALAPDTIFFWRVRASAGTVTSDWSAPQTFRTPDFTAGFRTSDPPPGQSLPLPDREHLINQLAVTHAAALADSCIEEGGSWDFMDAAVTALRVTDTRWGYNCKRGNCHDISIDVVDYFHGIGDGDGSTEVYLIDIISAVCPGGSQAPGWTDQTDVTAEEGAVGIWIFPRPPD